MLLEALDSSFRFALEALVLPLHLQLRFVTQLLNLGAEGRHLAVNLRRSEVSFQLQARSVLDRFLNVSGARTEERRTLLDNEIAQAGCKNAEVNPLKNKVLAYSGFRILFRCFLWIFCFLLGRWRFLRIGGERSQQGCG